MGQVHTHTHQDRYTQNPGTGTHRPWDSYTHRTGTPTCRTGTHTPQDRYIAPGTGTHTQPGTATHTPAQVHSLRDRYTQTPGTGTQHPPDPTSVIPITGVRLPPALSPPIGSAGTKRVPLPEVRPAGAGSLAQL